MRLLFICLFLFTTFSLQAQRPTSKLPKETYGIKYDPLKVGKSCIECMNLVNNRPSAVAFSLLRYENDIVFVMNDKAWFDMIFNDKDDAIAVDVIRRKQFPCRGPNDYDEKGFVRGTMTPPVYKKSLNRSSFAVEGMDVVVKVGEVPPQLTAETDLEFNLMIIKNDMLCYYVVFYDLPSAKLDLLKMDLYMDSLTTSSGEGAKGGTYTYLQQLQFTIPFEKNKSDYKPEDVKPLTDSLHLNKYNIKSVKIRAYSSVEGSEAKNVELQEKRAESIVKALQSFQNLTIKEEVTASENWVEFLNDVAGTPYLNFKSMSKDEIKAELEKKQVATDLEPILKKERKGILYIELEKKSQYKNLGQEEIKKQFLEAVQKKNIEEALEIQDAIFQNIDSKKYAPELIKELEVPEEKVFGDLLLNDLVYRTKNDQGNSVAILDKFIRLRDMMPEKHLINYNICVLELGLLRESEVVADRKTVLKDIKDLETKKIDKRLIRRLMINYNIILSDYLMREKRYAEKDKVLQYIYQNYKNINFNDDDLVRLAKYFSSFNKHDWSLKLIENRASSLGVSEDLLFYYINLTITDDDNIRKGPYRSILNNAYTTNPQRFCALFDAAHHGGVSFQLLSNLILRKTYCENCEDRGKKL